MGLKTPNLIFDKFTYAPFFTYNENTITNEYEHVKFTLAVDANLVLYRAFYRVMYQQIKELYKSMPGDDEHIFAIRLEGEAEQDIPEGATIISMDKNDQRKFMDAFFEIIFQAQQSMSYIGIVCVGKPWLYFDGKRPSFKDFILVNRTPMPSFALMRSLLFQDRRMSNCKLMHFPNVMSEAENLMVHNRGKNGTVFLTLDSDIYRICLLFKPLSRKDILIWNDFDKSRLMEFKPIDKLALPEGLCKKKAALIAHVQLLLVGGDYIPGLLTPTMYGSLATDPQWTFIEKPINNSWRDKFALWKDDELIREIGANLHEISLDDFFHCIVHQISLSFARKCKHQRINTKEYLDFRSRYGPTIDEVADLSVVSYMRRSLWLYNYDKTGVCVDIGNLVQDETFLTDKLRFLLNYRIVGANLFDFQTIAEPCCAGITINPTEVIKAVVKRKFTPSNKSINPTEVIKAVKRKFTPSNK